MNENDDKKDKMDENDPYNFFKLSTDPVDDKGNDKKRPGKKRRMPFWAFLLIALSVLVVINLLFFPQSAGEVVDFSTFRDMVESGKIVRVELGESTFVGYTTEANDEAGGTVPAIFRHANDQAEPTVYRTTGVLLGSFIELLDAKNVTYKFVTKSNNYFITLLINLLIPMLFLFLMYFFIFRKMGGGMGGMGSVLGANGKSKAVDEGKVKTRFSDVAGVDEAKEELVEVVDFLKEPKKYTDIGGKIPKGVLLVGPPGTGKTLLARAVAGEAGVPFFRISGSDFVEMFVGVGASRVRDLFKTAREKAPCIIFIDELDAIGKSRVNNLGGNDEREQTLNQLLVEMDGFDNEKGLIILAATNRADILDPALLRPGRFDRQVPVERPDVKGREEILRIHAKNVKLDDDVDFDSIAHGTSGFAGADLANVVNEAALLAVRNGRKKVAMLDFNEAIDKVSIGLKKKGKRENEKERKLVAVHETGHALIGAFTPEYPPVNKITVIPRSHGIGGYTQYREQEERNFMTRQDMINEVDTCLGGRAAEQIVLGEISTGAANDIARATEMIKSMICDYGMSDRFKNMTLGKSGRGYNGPQEPELVREFSEETQKYIDEEIARIIDERYKHVVKTLTAHKTLLEYVSDRLLQVETMEGKEFYEIVKAEDHCNKLEADSKKKALESPAADGKSDSSEKAGEEPKAKKPRATKPRAKKTTDE